MVLINYFKKNYGLALVLLLSFWAIKPLFAPGFFPMHDDTQVARVYEMGKALKDGMFPVRWVSDLGYGYGYPIFNFYAPLAYYVGGFFNIVGFDALASTKLMMVIGILFSGVFMYFLAREFWGEMGGVVSGLFYVYTPYHALDIFIRGDVAEFWAYAFIPLMFYGFYKAYASIRDIDTLGSNSKFKIQNSKLQLKIKNDIWKWIVVGSVGYAGVILSHNLTGLMVTPFLLIVILLYCYIAYKRKKLFTIYHSSLIIILGLLLSSFYWIPALFEMKYTNVLSQIGGGADFRDHFVCIQQLWESNWGFGGSVPGCIDGLSFKIGKLHLLVVFAASLIFIGKKIFSKIKFANYNDTYHYSDKILIVGLCILDFILSVFLTLEISKPIWELIYPMAFFQYPWRFLLIASFFSSLLSGFIIWFLHVVFKKAQYFSFKQGLYMSIGTGLVLLLIYFNAKLFQPQTILHKKSADYTNETALQWIASKISDEYMPKNFIKPNFFDEVPRAKISTLTEKSRIVELSEKTQRISALISNKKETKIHINTAYFPAWNIFLDNRKALYTVSNNGLFLSLPQGEHVLDIKFIQTPIERVANAISAISLISLIIGIIFSRKKIWL